MTKRAARISDDAVQEATGRTWADWFDTLDREGAGSKTHKEIAALLHAEGYIESGCWCQEVTVEYERARGRRAGGQTSTAGFEIGVQKTLPIPSERAWGLMTGPEGRRIWLGEVPELKLSKGHQYRTADGTCGEIRSVAEGKRLRLIWQPSDWGQPSTLQIYLLPSGKSTSIRFHQERLSGPEQREQMRQHWQEVLEHLQELV
jgi:uncharacterized protein YndB with AHSA1/START domain